MFYAQRISSFFLLPLNTDIQKQEAAMIIAQSPIINENDILFVTKLSKQLRRDFDDVSEFFDSDFFKLIHC